MDGYGWNVDQRTTGCEEEMKAERNDQRMDERSYDARSGHKKAEHAVR